MPVAGSLLKSPMDSKDQQKVEYSREVLTSDTRDQSKRFLVGQKDFQIQYFHIYTRRSETIRPLVEKNARIILNKKDIQAIRLASIDKVKTGTKCLIVGTIYKHQDLKPNILKELSEENCLMPQPSHTRYVGENDELILEDEMQRIKLLGKVNVSAMVTGVVCGFYGAEKESGKFFVEQTIFAYPPPQPERPLLEKDMYVVFISGLNLADMNTSSCLTSLQLAVDWICGEAGEMDDQLANSGIIKVIIAGNSVSESTQNKEDIKKAKYLTNNTKAGSIEAINILDDILVQLVGSVDCDLMAGEFDPASSILPQQPLHPCLFPLSSAYSTFHSVTNPYALETNGFHFLGSSGQNVQDVSRNSSLENPIDVLESMLTWSHIAPTCPDTLGCFPYRDQDPFIVNQLPHVMFTGNQKKFQQSTFKTSDNKSVQVLSIPTFSETHSIISLNLRSFKAEEIKFSANFN